MDSDYEVEERVAILLENNPGLSEGEARGQAILEIAERK